MPVKFETGEKTRDGSKGFSAACSGYNVETMAWHGSKSGAENLAGWKWLREVYYRSAVDKNLYDNWSKNLLFRLLTARPVAEFVKRSLIWKSCGTMMNDV
ncbi:unnamed protein product [Brachionus calyciflorus]|uniref:Uncharacterized protein n=1 Tax=Brachionus calyciflorus TaxID=104777 RepID=A0A814B3Q2_9BILA|nr:unnamed protein product [Brachionus calyciflorus]